MSGAKKETSLKGRLSISRQRASESEGAALELLLFGLLIILSVFGEGVEKVVDDLSPENTDAQTVGHLLTLPLHFHVEGQDHSVSDGNRPQLE